MVILKPMMHVCIVHFGGVVVFIMYIYNVNTIFL